MAAPHNLLVVESDPVMQRLVHAWLASLGVAHTQASGGALFKAIAGDWLLLLVTRRGALFKAIAGYWLLLLVTRRGALFKAITGYWLLLLVTRRGPISAWLLALGGGGEGSEGSVIIYTSGSD